MVVLSYYSKCSNWQSTHNIPNTVQFSLINSSVIYKQKNKTKPLDNNDYIIEKTTKDDCKLLPDKDNDNAHDYIQQIKDGINDEMSEVFTLKTNGEAVCFFILNDVESKKFNEKFKIVSAVYTLPDKRKKGYAQILIKNILCFYKDEEFLYVADSDKNTASNSLAASCGFEVVGFNHQIEIQT